MYRIGLSPSRLSALIVFLATSMLTSMAWSGKKKPVFPGVQFAYAKAFLFNTHETERQTAIYEAGTWATTKIDDGRTLSKSQIKALHRAVNRDPELLLGGLSKCFIPRHGVVYYDAQDTPVASLSICFECEGIQFYPMPKKLELNPSKMSEKRVRMVMKDLKAMEMVLSDVGLPVFESQRQYARYVDSKKSTLEGRYTVTLVDDDWMQKALGDTPNLAFFRTLLGEKLPLESATGEAPGHYAAEGVTLTINDADQSIVSAAIRNRGVRINGVALGLSLEDLRRSLPEFPADKNPRFLNLKSTQSPYQLSFHMKNKTLQEIRISRAGENSDHGPTPSPIEQPSEAPSDEVKTTP